MPHHPIGRPARYQPAPRTRVEIDIDGELWAGDSYRISRYIAIGGVEVTRITLTNPRGIVEL